MHAQAQQQGASAGQRVTLQPYGGAALSAASAAGISASANIAGADVNLTGITSNWLMRLKDSTSDPGQSPVP